MRTYSAYLGLFTILLTIESLLGTPTFFNQCDPKWAKKNINNNQGKTICDAGSLITVMAMIANGCGQRIKNEDITPLNLNEWLGKNNGF